MLVSLWILIVINHILSEMVWWALFNASLIMWICPAIHEILANKAFTVTDGLISQLFVVTFVHPAYVQIALIWGFLVQLSLWKSVYWLWRYKLNKVCDNLFLLLSCMIVPNRELVNTQFSFDIGWRRTLEIHLSSLQHLPNLTTNILKFKTTTNYGAIK